MQIIRDRRISESHWQHVPEGALTGKEGMQPAGAIIVALADWRRHKARLLGRGTPVGVRLASDDAIDDIVDDLDSIALVAVAFASFTDGRGYTLARRLRDIHGYEREIRAVGDVSRDHLAFMERCGFNAFELRPHSDLREALKAFDEISVVYQPAADRQPPGVSRRA
jgi:uncharacterized protein (DUF934 family)